MKSILRKHPTVKKLLKTGNKDVLRTVRRPEVQKAFQVADEESKEKLIEVLPFVEPARREMRRISLMQIRLPEPLVGVEARKSTSLLTPTIYFLDESYTPIAITGLNQDHSAELRIRMQRVEITFTQAEWELFVKHEDRLMDFMLEEDSDNTPLYIGAKSVNFLCGVGRYLEVASSNSKLILANNNLFALFKYRELLSKRLKDVTDIHFNLFYKTVINMIKDIDSLVSENLPSHIINICTTLQPTDDQLNIMCELLFTSRNTIMRDVCACRESVLAINRQQCFK